MGIEIPPRPLSLDEIKQINRNNKLKEILGIPRISFLEKIKKIWKK